MSSDDALLANIARKILADEVMISLTREADGSGTLSVETDVDLTSEEADAAGRFIEALHPDAVTLYSAYADGPDWDGHPWLPSVGAARSTRYLRGEVSPTTTIFPSDGTLRAWASGFPTQEEALEAAVEAVTEARLKRVAEQAARREALTPEAQARSIAEHAGWLRQTEGRGF